MKREVKFRGMHTHTEKWIYGSLVIYERGEVDEYIIHPKNSDSASHHVVPESVGQFTGLVDKNGKQIYEGDILASDYYNGIVVWDDIHAGWWVSYNNATFLSNLMGGKNMIYTVTGNIYENSDLV